MRGLPSCSLSLRLFLIVLGGVLLSITLSNAFHSHERARLVEEYLEKTAIDHFTDTIQLLATLAPEARISAVKALPAADWQFERVMDLELLLGLAAPSVSAGLTERLENSAEVEGAWVDPAYECEETPRCPKKFGVRVRFRDGQELILAYTAKAHGRPHHPLWRVLRYRDLLVVGVMAIVAWIVVRLAMRPLQRLTQAVECFGRDISHPALKEEGPSEVRRAVGAFNDMQEQIRGFLADRTQILAAVTHDLKTPMTCMRLRLENVTNEELRQKLKADLAAMQVLVDEGLDLAKSLESGEPTKPVDLQALLQSICDDLAESGMNVVYQDGSYAPRVVVMAQPHALRRIFENVIDNAIKYGQFARVTLESLGGMIWIHVRDGGPGIPEEQRPQVLKPFVRLEASRSRETGGTGLGLAIAANLLKSQRGEIKLENLSQGGLDVAIGLPISASF